MADSWFRFYNTAPDHPKVLMLSDWQFRAWVILLCMASKMGGVIPGAVDLLATTLRKPQQKTADTIQVLLSAGLVDMVETGYEPHNWTEKQFKSDVSTERVKRFRNAEMERKRNGPETEAETNTETERKILPRALRAEFDEKFWPEYPKKVAKGTAFKAFSKARKGVECPVILAGLSRYVAARAGQDPQFTLNPATWLNGEGWNDEIQTPGDGPKLRLVSPETEAAELENLKKLGVI